MKNRTNLLLVIVAVASLALLYIDSVEAVEVVDEQVRDPLAEYDPAPGQSYSYVHLYALYNPETQHYWGIKRDHDYDWIDGTGDYSQYINGANDEHHPWGETIVSYKYTWGWDLDTDAYIMF